MSVKYVGISKKFMLIVQFISLEKITYNYVYYYTLIHGIDKNTETRMNKNNTVTDQKTRYQRKYYFPMEREV